MSTIPEHAKKVFSGVLYDVYQWPQQLYDGSTTTFEMLRRVDAAIVVGITPDKQVLLIEDSQPNRQVKLTFPGGHINPAESPLAAAKRELMEEAGYTSERWGLWKTYQAAEKIEAYFHYYIARDIQLSGEPSLDPGEIIHPRLVSMDEFLEGIITGRQYAYDFGAEIMRELLQDRRQELIAALLGDKN